MVLCVLAIILSRIHTNSKHFILVSKASLKLERMNVSISESGQALIAREYVVAFVLVSALWHYFYH